MDHRLMISQLSGQLTEAENEVRRVRLLATKLQHRLDATMETNHFMSLVTAFSAELGSSPEQAIARAVETMDACSAHFQAEYAKQAEAKRLEAEAQAEAQAKAQAEAEADADKAEPDNVIDFPAGKEIAEKAATVEKEGAD